MLKVKDVRQEYSQNYCQPEP